MNRGNSTPRKPNVRGFGQSGKEITNPEKEVILRETPRSGPATASNRGSLSSRGSFRGTPRGSFRGTPRGSSRGGNFTPRGSLPVRGSSRGSLPARGSSRGSLSARGSSRGSLPARKSNAGIRYKYTAPDSGSNKKVIKSNPDAQKEEAKVLIRRPIILEGDIKVVKQKKTVTFSTRVQETGDDDIMEKQLSDHDKINNLLNKYGINQLNVLTEDMVDDSGRTTQVLFKQIHKNYIPHLKSHLSNLSVEERVLDGTNIEYETSQIESILGRADFKYKPLAKVIYFEDDTYVPSKCNSCHLDLTLTPELRDKYKGKRISEVMDAKIFKRGVKEVSLERDCCRTTFAFSAKPPTPYDPAEEKAREETKRLKETKPDLSNKEIDKMVLKKRATSEIIVRLDERKIKLKKQPPKFDTVKPYLRFQLRHYPLSAGQRGDALSFIFDVHNKGYAKFKEMRDTALTENSETLLNELAKLDKPVIALMNMFTETNKNERALDNMDTFYLNNYENDYFRDTLDKIWSLGVEIYKSEVKEEEATSDRLTKQEKLANQIELAKNAEEIEALQLQYFGIASDSKEEVERISSISTSMPYRLPVTTIIPVTTINPNSLIGLIEL